ncbi:IpaC/SipC family type III secretion system effector (plasmid) [Burkholderia pyrrocinia]|uniref:IpaC/SipC family type III secretion system effector n=1 Tax=Burkholderia pyrrocinia TaxID=60550 RepID=UPI0038B604BA
MMNAVQLFQPNLWARPPVSGDTGAAADVTTSRSAAAKSTAAVAAAIAGARQAGRDAGSALIELTPPATPRVSRATLQALNGTLERLVQESGSTAGGLQAQAGKGTEGGAPVKSDAPDDSGSLFGNSAVDDGFDVLIAMTTTLQATSVAYQKMGASMAVSELKVTQEQAQKIVDQGEDELAGAIGGACLQISTSVGGMLSEFKGLKINKDSLEEQMGRANRSEEGALKMEQSLVGPNQSVQEEVREVRLERSAHAGAEQAEEGVTVEVEPSPQEPTWKHSQTVAKETARMRARNSTYRVNHEQNFIRQRRWEARGQLMTTIGYATSRVAEKEGDNEAKRDHAAETMDGRLAELCGTLATAHRDNAQKERSVEADLLAAVKALMSQQSELGSVVASKIV